MLEKAVCDASVLINFAKARKLELLLGVFQNPLFVPDEVYAEAVVNGIEKKEPDARVIEEFVERKLIVVKKTRAMRLPFLDAGECAVISLALERGIKLVCIDETPGRNAAKQFGLKPVGTLGVLTFLLKKKRLSRAQLLNLLDEMVERDYRISAKVLDAFKKAVGQKSV